MVRTLPSEFALAATLTPPRKVGLYASNETGRYEVWMEPLPQTGTRYQLTRDGGSHPLWAPDGQSVYFDRGQQLFRLKVTAREPVPLPIKGFQQAEYRRQFDLMPNGRQFLMLFPVKSAGPDSVPAQK